jgi:RimJ/RimL family protein N-acetyltransferase
MSNEAATFDSVSFHALALDELHRFVTMPGSSGSAHPHVRRDFFKTMAAANYRPRWTWVAEREGVVIARAAWWAPPQASFPFSLDWFDVGPGPKGVAVGAELLRRAHGQVLKEDGGSPEYHLFLPEAWSGQPDAAATTRRLEAAGQAGLTEKPERWHLTWAESHGPARRNPDRLTYRSVGTEDDSLVLDLLRRILQGTLDSFSREDVGAHGVEETARRDLEYLASFPAPREWWRIGCDADGAPVGIVFPARNFEHAIIAYLGVVPEQRGKGHGLDLLLEATRVLSALGADEIHADTDLGNIPMANAFRAAGYRLSRHKVLG